MTISPELRKAVFDRDKVCQHCSGSKWLQIHHIKDTIAGEDIDAYSMEELPNLLLLCRKCHLTLHKSRGEGKHRVRSSVAARARSVALGCYMHRWQRGGGKTICQRCGDVYKPTTKSST